MPDHGIAAGFALSRRLSSAAVAARHAPPTEWADREQQAIDALRAAAAFLANHAGSPVARAITATMTKDVQICPTDWASHRETLSSKSPATSASGECMAQIQMIRLVDDLTGGDADDTVSFSLDGKQFEIDLSADNAQKLRNDLAEFLTAARPARKAEGQRIARSERTNRSASSSVEERRRNQQIRTWARQNGYTVSDRGRIPTEVITAYYANATPGRRSSRTTTHPFTVPS